MEECCAAVNAALTTRSKRPGPAWAKDATAGRWSRALWAVAASSADTPGVLAIVEDMRTGEATYLVAWLVRVSHGKRNRLKVAAAWPLHKLSLVDRCGGIAMSTGFAGRRPGGASHSPAAVGHASSNGSASPLAGDTEDQECELVLHFTRLQGSAAEAPAAGPQLQRQGSAYPSHAAPPLPSSSTPSSAASAPAHPPWRCTLPTAATRDEAVWRLLAGASALCGSPPTTHTFPSDELEAMTHAHLFSAAAVAAAADHHHHHRRRRSSVSSVPVWTDPLLKLLRLLPRRSNLLAVNTRGSGAAGGAVEKWGSGGIRGGAGLLLADSGGGVAGQEALHQRKPQTGGGKQQGDGDDVGDDDESNVEAERVLSEVVKWESTSSSSSSSSASSFTSETTASSSSALVLSASEVDGKLLKGMEAVERDTVECLLAWELSQFQGASHATAARVGFLEDDANLRAQSSLLETLNELGAELAAMEGWLESNAAYVNEMRLDMLSIESLNNMLEARSKNYEKTEFVLGTLLDGLTLDDQVLGLLRDPLPLLLDQRLTQSQFDNTVRELIGAMSQLGTAVECAKEGYPPLNATATAGNTATPLSPSHATDAAAAAGGGAGGGAVASSSASSSSSPSLAARAEEHERTASQFKHLKAVQEQQTTLTALQAHFTTQLATALHQLLARVCHPSNVADLAAAVSAADAYTAAAEGEGGSGKRGESGSRRRTMSRDGSEGSEGHSKQRPLGTLEEDEDDNSRSNNNGGGSGGGSGGSGNGLVSQASNSTLDSGDGEEEEEESRGGGATKPSTNSNSSRSSLAAKLKLQGGKALRIVQRKSSKTSSSTKLSFLSPAHKASSLTSYSPSSLSMFSSTPSSSSSSSFGFAPSPPLSTHAQTTTATSATPRGHAEVVHPKNRSGLKELSTANIHTVGDASGRLVAAQNALHRALRRSVGALNEALLELDPPLLVKLCKAYAVESERLYYLHAKAFFRLILPQVKSSKDAHVCLLTLQPAKPIIQASTNLLATTTTPDEPTPASRSGSGRNRPLLSSSPSSSSFNVSMFSLAASAAAAVAGEGNGGDGEPGGGGGGGTLGHGKSFRKGLSFTRALEATLDTFLPAIEAEGVFFTDLFRLDKATSSSASSNQEELLGDPSSPSSPLSASPLSPSLPVSPPSAVASSSSSAAAAAADFPSRLLPPTTTETEALVFSCVEEQFGKALEKMTAGLVEAPEVSQSAELLTMLHVVRSRLRRLEDEEHKVLKRDQRRLDRLGEGSAGRFSSPGSKEKGGGNSGSDSNNSSDSDSDSSASSSSSESEEGEEGGGSQESDDGDDDDDRNRFAGAGARSKSRRRSSGDSQNDDEDEDDEERRRSWVLKVAKSPVRVWVKRWLQRQALALEARWQKFVQGQVEFVSSTLSSSKVTDVRQAGVLGPVLKFVSFVEAVEAHTAHLLVSAANNSANASDSASGNALGVASVAGGGRRGTGRTRARNKSAEKQEAERLLKNKLTAATAATEKPASAVGEGGDDESAAAASAGKTPTAAATTASVDLSPPSNNGNNGNNNNNGNGNSNKDDDGMSASRAFGYVSVGQALFAGLEHAAGANVKYRDVVRMENYYFFAHAVSSKLPTREKHARVMATADEDEGCEEGGGGGGGGGLEGGVSSFASPGMPSPSQPLPFKKTTNSRSIRAVPSTSDDEDGRGDNESVSTPTPASSLLHHHHHHRSTGAGPDPEHELDGCVRHAWAQYRSCLGRYLEWHFAYECKELEGYLQRIEGLVSTRGVSDVRIHESKDRLLSTIRDHASTRVLREKFKQIYKRVAKHLDVKLGLLPHAWASFAAFLQRKWELFSTRCRQCYDVELNPPPRVLGNLVRDVGGEL